jgi:hypothetical protein
MKSLTLLFTLLSCCCYTIDAYHGHVTFYDLNPGDPVACEVTVQSADIPNLAAVDAGLYDNPRGALCNRCVRVYGPSTSIVARIVDRCVGCGNEGVDLTRQGFSQLASTDVGRMELNWELVDCRSGQSARSSSPTLPSAVASARASAINGDNNSDKTPSANKRPAVSQQPAVKKQEKLATSIGSDEKLKASIGASPAFNGSTKGSPTADSVAPLDELGDLNQPLIDKISSPAASRLFIPHITIIIVLLINALIN